MSPIRRCGREGEGDGSGSVSEGIGSVTDGPQGDGYCKLQAKRCKGEEGGRKQEAAWRGTLWCAAPRRLRMQGSLADEVVMCSSVYMCILRASGHAPQA